ncbi:MAG: alpha/beta fold hydrolase [Promethearchaeota archaeon]
MPYFDYSGKKIYYHLIDNSSQQTLIFIHGSGGNSNIWKNQFKLKVECNIIAIDLPSHNNSDEFPELSLNLYVDIVKRLVDILKIKKLILCGHSLGGAIIQDYYFNNSNDVSALILCATGARLRVSPFIFNTLKKSYQEYLDYIKIIGFYRKTSEEIIFNNMEEVSHIKPEVTYNDFKICNQFDTLNITSSINVPCLIVCGKDDKLTPVKYSEYFKDNIQNSELKIINKAGHMVMIEKPKQVNKAIENFIKTHLN